MSFLKNFKISAQINVLVMISVGFSLILTVVAWYAANNLYNETNYENEKSIPSIVVLNEAQLNAATAQVTTWQFVAQVDPARRKDIEAQRITVLQDVRKALDEYEKLVSDDRDEQLLKADQAELSDYIQLTDQAIDLAKQGKTQEASDFLLEKHVLLKVLSEKLSDHAAFNINLAKDHALLASQEQKTMLLQLLVVTLVASIVLAWVGFTISRAVSKPVATAVAAAERISQGDLSVPIDLSTVGLNTEAGRLLNSLKTMDMKLGEIVGSVSETADVVGTAARQISQGNDDLSSRTQEQASALEETAATMEEMTAAVKRNSDSANQADQLGRQARNRADASTEVVQRTVSAMDEINTSSRKIGDIINVIDEIAFQTNLLALNAAVEAARAGEQGRGFAVVASEVRNLAQRSATAAKEIKTLIQDSMRKVQTGTALVHESGKSLGDIVTDVKHVTDIVAEIAAATSEQANAINQINHAVIQMDTTTQQNAALVEEAASASKSMEDQTHDLLNRISFFKLSGQARCSPAVVSGASPPAAKPVSVSTLATTPHRTPRTAFRTAVGDDQSWSEF